MIESHWGLPVVAHRVALGSGRQVLVGRDGGEFGDFPPNLSIGPSSLVLRSGRTRGRQAPNGQCCDEATLDGQPVLVARGYMSQIDFVLADLHKDWFDATHPDR